MICSLVSLFVYELLCELCKCFTLNLIIITILRKLFKSFILNLDLSPSTMHFHSRPPCVVALIWACGVLVITLWLLSAGSLTHCSNGVLGYCYFLLCKWSHHCRVWFGKVWAAVNGYVGLVVWTIGPRLLAIRLWGWALWVNFNGFGTMMIVCDSFGLQVVMNCHVCWCSSSLEKRKKLYR